MRLPFRRRPIAIEARNGLQNGLWRTGRFGCATALGHFSPFTFHRPLSRATCNEAAPRLFMRMSTGEKANTRVALVTGAAQGIGRAVARVLAQRGFALALNDLRPPVETSADVRDLTSSIELVGDIADENVVADFAEKVKSMWGRADVLVNNAGISSISRAEDTSVTQFRRVLEVNLVGPFILSRVFGSLMLAQGSGSIINIASIAGLMGIADRVAYNASKHGMIGLTRTLAAEWGGRGVRCNAVCPAWVKTPMDTADQASSGYTDVDITDRVPMGRFASPADIAAAVVFLADSEQSGFINGQAIAVDGGWTTDGTWESLRLKRR
jgi:NAD(P)-dependent dehydrogenase (short-subunit alcohol dehydrogenase family)